MLSRLEGSRRALKGTFFESLVRRNLENLIGKYKLPLKVGEGEVKILDETYDIQIVGLGGSLLVPVKTRETMGGGHALLFTRDIYKSILVATENGHICVPVVIAESWSGDLEALKSELYVYIQANPNQILEIEPLLADALETLLPILEKISRG
jgi:hydroxymethylglutaryl-CoA reductase